MNYPRILLAASLVLSGVSLTQADVKLASVFTDGMVLQRNAATPIWGKADPGEPVTVTFAGQVKATKAAPDGKWMLKLDPLEVNAKPAEMTVKGNNEIVLKDILVGDVWLCSGQSNMAWRMTGSKQIYEKEIASADNPAIRGLSIGKVVADEPQESLSIVGSKWVACTPQSVLGFSAVSYFFGRELNEKLQIPIGLIMSAYGGTPAEAWTPLDCLKADSDFAAHVSRYEFECQLRQRVEDPGVKPETAGWAEPGIDLSSWEKVNAPSGWFTDKNLSGAVWFRREIEVPAEWAGEKLRFDLGWSSNTFTTFFNGAKVGALGGELPAGLVKAGRNTIVVRLFARDAIPSSFGGDPKRFRLFVAGKEEASISLTGEWYRKIENAIKTFPAFPNQNAYSDLSAPVAFYNGMIAPVIPFAIKGVIWYQGESNAGRPVEYQKLFPSLIQSWRGKWAQGDFPFYFCQLANVGPKTSNPGEPGWAAIREAQSMALKVPHTGQAVLIDIGEAAEIHPLNKRDAGNRLALIALARDYGQKIPYSGPVYASMKSENGKIRLSFAPVEGGLVARPVPETYVKSLTRHETAPLVRNSPQSELEGFVICGEDKKWVWADAKIEGDTVVVWSDQVPAPVAVRYGWGGNPTCNLYNKSDLPASPFRTDDFP